MKNLIFTLALMCVASLAFGQLKVVAPNGDVGIGTSTPTEKLEVDGLAKTLGNTVIQTGASGTTLFERTDGAAVLMGAGFTAAGFTVDQNYNFEVRTRARAQVQNRLLSAGYLMIKGQGSTGRVGINVASPAELFHVNGDAQANGIWINSDMALKGDVRPFDLGLDAVMALSPKTYQYHNANVQSRSVGLIAQDLQEIAPSLVKTYKHVEENEKGEIISEEEFLKIYDTGIKYMLVNAIQEQQQMIEDLQQEVANLKSNGGIATQEDNFSSAKLVLSNLEVSEISRISPNPFQYTARVDFNLPVQDFTSAILTVFDVDGKIINQTNLTTQIGTIEIDARQLASGIYNYVIEVDGNVVDNQKFVKE